MVGVFSGRTVLVTGAAGFLGSALGPRLVAEGAHVVAADNFSFARPDQPGGTEIRNLDIREVAQVEGLLKETQADVVIHLAAVANPRTCKQDFPLAYDVNVGGTQNLLRYLPAKSRFVFMSSAAVYGEPLYLPLDENHPRRGSDPYSVTKIIGEDLCQNYVGNYQRSVVIARNFNAFGVGQTGDYIVPQLIRQALVEGKIELWDSRTIRDLTYVANTVDALIAIAASDKTGVFNIGSGRGMSVGELAHLIGRRLGDVPVVDLKKKVLGSPVLVSNNSRLRELGWTESVAFEEGVDRTIEWMRRMVAAAPAAPGSS
ncbi:MAG TPA: NAD-dependent epimerase/dehydratase family protein [Thermoplasmata archaeon]|nr:NAD-dependent epimerase/dehydratase family protein [Thermoplasmata archaeon]